MMNLVLTPKAEAVVTNKRFTWPEQETINLLYSKQPKARPLILLKVLRSSVVPVVPLLINDSGYMLLLKNFVKQLHFYLP